ncbi:DUF2306 domain-containing protein [Paenibacillus kobensis]|uniref:DUF2306 domain-containing protein n=1 Tax=Paenibacillus kobensis TaxID=59841 RepID=UPI0013E2DA60|nr:DUF2306 domain-containing protein [Paenibacillus kobensis]
MKQNAKGLTVPRWVFGLLALLSVGIGLYAFAFYGSLDNVQDTPFAEDKGSLPDEWHIFLWAHAVSAGTAILIGWLQFVKRFRRRTAAVHRVIGYIYSVMLLIAGLTGLYLAFYANGGLIGQVGFAALSVAWLYTLLRGLKSIIVDRRPLEHGQWMLRNYALTCAAIMLRIYVPIAAAFGVSDTNDSFTVIAWLCWVPNLLVAEMLIRSKNSSNYRRVNPPLAR